MRDKRISRCGAGERLYTRYPTQPRRATFKILYVSARRKPPAIASLLDRPARRYRPRQMLTRREVLIAGATIAAGAGNATLNVQVNSSHVALTIKLPGTQPPSEYHNVSLFQSGHASPVRRGTSQRPLPARPARRV